MRILCILDFYEAHIARTKDYRIRVYGILFRITVDKTTTVITTIAVRTKNVRTKFLRTKVKHSSNQGTFTEGEGSVQLTSLY
jgi:hypothetical protein